MRLHLRLLAIELLAQSFEFVECLLGGTSFFGVGFVLIDGLPDRL